MPYTEQPGFVKSVKIGSYSAPDTLIDISGALTAADENRATDDLDITALKDKNKQHLPGLGDWALALTGNWSPEIDAHLGGVAFTQPPKSVAVEYGPMGTDSGSPKRTGRVYLLGYNSTGGVADKQAFTGSLAAASDIVTGTFT